MKKAISLYTGIGGLDFGFEAAGFDTKVALEFDPTACKTLRLNRTWPIIEDDVNNVSSKHIMNTAGLGVGEADILIGGPPCQPFSKSSYWVNGDSLRLDDPRADTLTGYLRILRDIQPKAFLIENVAGLAFKKKDEGLSYLSNGIKQINHETGCNYTFDWALLNCAEYGVPQIRERVFIIGSREGHSFNFPATTHSKVPDPQLGLFTSPNEPYRNVWDAIGDLPEPDAEKLGLKVGGKWGDLLSSIPEGENYLWHTNRKGGKPIFGWRTRYWSFLLKLSKRLPSWTVQAQPGSAIGPFHWNNRKLSFEELCRLQTFPDGLKVTCGRTQMQRMLGNAVPSLITEILAREIKSQFFNEQISKPLQLLPPRRKNLPPPEQLKPIHSKYLSLVGDHPDHPGTGKGRRSIKKHNREKTTTVNV